jgi:predicted Ser/Thr protein kinase
MADAPPATSASDAPARPAGDAAGGALEMSDGPRQLGKYRIRRELGQGGMSVVYLGRDDALDRLVALKLLHRHLARDPEARARLSREARASARLTHPHIPEIYDFSGADGHDDGRAFIVSEFVDGPSLAEMFRAAPPRLPESGVLLLIGVARALAHAHAAGIIHRDVKPENILVGKDGIVRLTDFGIAHVIGLESMTMTGTLIGSPQHMAPEQIDGSRDLDHRVDVWGFGTVLFMALAGGCPPFEGDNPHQLLRRIVEGERRDIRRLNPHVDAALGRIVDRCMARDRGARYPAMQAVVDDLEAWLAARGLGDARAELKAMVPDVLGYERSLSGRLVAPLFAASEAAEAARDTPRALELLGRVLLLDPDHEGAATRLRRIERRMTTRRRAGLAMVGLALTGGAVVAAVLALGSPPAEVAPSASPTGGPRATPEPTAMAGAAPVEGLLPVSVAPERVPAGEAEGLGASGPSADASAARVEGTTDEAATGGGEESTAEAAMGVDAPPDGAARPATAESPPRPEAPRGADPAEVPPATSPPAPARPRPKPRAAQRVATTLTVFPPAVRIALDGKDIPAGRPVPLDPGVHTVTLVHPGCESCGAETHRLEVPDDGSETLRRHFTFSRQPDLAPATLLVTCGAGGWVETGSGTRYPCNVEHSLPVTSDRPTLLILTAFDAAGTRLDTRRFTIRPKAPIVWRL